MSHNNAYNIFLRKDIDKRFSESESTINFASGNGQFRNITNFKEITIFSEAFHLNAFLYGATSSIFNQLLLITHAPINVKFYYNIWKH